MALAKYYEDILERLDEDRKSILKKLNTSEFRRATDGNLNIASHIESHLREADKLFNELLEIITNPNHQTPIDSISLKSEKALNNNLETELEKSREIAESSKATARRMKEDRDIAIQNNIQLNNEIEKLKRHIKQQKKEIKNAKRK